MDATFFSKDKHLLSTICSDLKKIGCCSRCTLRFIGLADMFYFRGDFQEMNNLVEKICKAGDKTIEIGDKNDPTETETIKNQIDEEVDKGQDSAEQVDMNGTEIQSINEENGSEVACVVCLGILQKYSSLEFIDKVKSHTEEFTFTTYMCSLALPVCVILREHAVMIYLKEKYPDVYGEKTTTDVAEIKSVWKWRNGPVLKKLMDASFESRSMFNIIMNFTYKNSDQECNFLLDSDTDTFRKRKEDKRYRNKSKKSEFTLYNQANVSKAIEAMPEKDFRSAYQCPPRPPTSELLCDIKCQHDNVFVAGRYNKYSRTLSQTPWLIEGVRKSESSVEELLCTEINKFFKPSEQRFSSSGREDVDVLMLGNGRPFVLELVNPRCRDFTQDQMTEIQQKINESTKDIQCKDLQIVSREDTERLKEGEIDKVKQYSALCWCKEKVDKEKLNILYTFEDLKILQKTPIRVLHRRPLATRDKLIHSMSVEQIDDQHFKVGLSTQAGTYIKEFIHGDFGRTKPNMTSLLGVECDILELDVTAVELDWPKKVDT